MTDQAASDLAKKRWDATPKKQRQAIAREISNARWEQWRLENPEKAAASEARRAKRAAKKAKKRPG